MVTTLLKVVEISKRSKIIVGMSFKVVAMHVYFETSEVHKNAEIYRRF